jgi:2-dehydro-3-deoxyphosphooctonate aldolase (KDO 8-P synthase)
MTGLWSPAPVLMAGPCVVEREDVNLTIAASLAELATKLGLRVVYKASFDKANRSRANARRGPGLDAGIAALARVRDATGLPVMTDVHEPWQVERVAPHVDALQIPAFLCRQTDLLVAAGRSGSPVNIKKGQWMSPEAMAGAVEKVRAGGGFAITVTERGSVFGYGDLVVDMRSFARLRAATGVPAMFDATHATQQPGGGPQGATGGVREHVPVLLKAAAAAGADGFFIETHPTPERAPSDAATMWPLAELPSLVERTLEIWHAAREGGARACSIR